MRAGLFPVRSAGAASRICGDDGAMRRLFIFPQIQGRRLRRRFDCLLLLIFFPLFSSSESPSSLVPTDIEAAYLYNFGKFVRFPAAPTQDPASFSICILGEDRFAGALDSLIANESIEGRKIVTRRLLSPELGNHCQILYIAPSEENRVQKDLAALDKKPVLTVSSLPGFLERGGMVQFLLQNNRVRFAVNLAAAEKSGLSLSSDLLKVAVRVETQPAMEAK